MPRPALTVLGSVLLLGLSLCLVGAGPPAAPDQDQVLLAVEGPLAPGVAELLTRLTAFHGDFGTIAVAEAAPAVVTELARRGVRAVTLGPWPAGMDLVVTHAEPAEGEAQAPEGQVLFATSRQALVAVPAGAIAAIAGHRGALVSRTAFTTGPGFAAVAPGLSGLPGVQSVLSTDPRITPLVAQVNASNILASVTQLSSYFTRRADSALVLQARDWIIGQLNAMGGWTVSTQTFNASYGPNIVAERLGSVHPERLVVLGAHYDSINASGSALAAPGADDNASGSSGLLEVARILKQGNFENTVRCVWFCAEEFGTVGSEAHAAALDAQNAQVVAMLNMDMIAHLEAGDAFDLDFATNDTDAALTQFCRDITAAYVPALPTVTGVLTAGSSDHAPFAAHGFPAAFLFEDLTLFSQVLHTANDSLPNSPNNFTLAHDITQTFIAAAATIAAPVDMTLAHTALGDTADAGGPYALAVGATSLTPAAVASVQAFYKVNGGSQQSVALMKSNVAGQWVGSLPGIAQAALSQASIDYWLLATDAGGNTQWLPEALLPGGASYHFTVATLAPIFSDGFEGPTDNGWTHTLTAQQDDWQRGAPHGAAGDPSAAAEGLSIWGNDLGGSGWNGSYASSVDNRLESPNINCSGKSHVHLRFSRWLTVEDGTFDHASIAVNGTTVWQNPATPGGTSHTLDSAWSLQDLDISALADNNAAVKLRFRLQSDAGLEFGGWNVDDVALVSEGPGTVQPLRVSALHLSATAGGALSFALDAGPAFAGRKYILALSASGTLPGTPLGPVTVPLNFDALTTLGFNLLNTAVLPSAAGLLSAQGKAAASFVSPPVAAAAGLHLSFAFFTFGPFGYASNAVTVEYEP